MPSPSTVRFPLAPRGRQQLGLERAVDDIRHHGIGGERGKVKVERLLAGHAEAGGIDQQARARERPLPVLPIDHS